MTKRINRPRDPAQLAKLMIDIASANAMKYGALSNSAGLIEIASSAVDEKTWRLSWTEKGGPPVQEPIRHSFGTRLIGRLAEQLHGEVRLKYEPAGFVYELDIPVNALRERTTI
jgi:two-component sensor histidine kinase